MVKTKENNNKNDDKSRLRKRIIMIIIIVIIILLLLTSCTSTFWGKIGSLFTYERSFNIEENTNDREKIINKDLKFNISSLKMYLSDDNAKVVYYYKNINPKKFTCTTTNTKVAACYVRDGYVVIVPRSSGEVKVILKTTTNGKIYQATLPVTIGKSKRYISLSNTRGTIDLNKNRIKYVSYNLIGLRGKVKVSIDNNIADVSIYHGTIKIVGKSKGNATIKLSVIYNNREYTAYYNLKIVKGKTKSAVVRDSNSYLKSLKPSSGKLNFNSKTYKYYLSVPNNVSKMTFKASLSSKKSTMTYTFNGKKVKSLRNLKLKVGNNKLTIVVKAENGNVTKYEITINRSKKTSSKSTKLESLSVSKGKLIPKFNPDVLNYNVVVDNDVKSLDVKAKPKNDKAKVKYKYNGKTKDNLDDLDLKVGKNVVEVTVTDESGNETTYTVTIERKAREETTSNYLKDITVSDNLKLNEEFKKDNYSYTLDVPYNQDEVTFKGIPENENSKVTYKFNGKESDGKNLKLNSGNDNVLEITVTDENGNTKTYTVTINKKVRTIAFDYDKYIVPGDVSSYTIGYTVYDDGESTEDYDLSEIKVTSDDDIGEIIVNRGSITIKPKIKTDFETKLHITTLVFEKIKYFLESQNRYIVDMEKDTGKGSIVLENNLFDGEIIEEPLPGGGLRLRSSTNPDIYIDVTSDSDVTFKYKDGNGNLVIEVEVTSPGKHQVDVKASKDDLNLQIELEVVEKHVLIIDANGGFFDSFTTKYEYKYTTEDKVNVSLSDYVPYKTDDAESCTYFKLESYNTSPDGTGKRYEKDAVITSLDSDLTLYAIYEVTSEKVILEEGKKLYLTDVDFFHNEKYYSLYKKDKIIYPGANGSYIMNLNNNTGSTITIESITLKENNDVCKNIGCVNMGYIIKDPSTYYLGASSKYEILNDGSEKTDSEKIVSVPITIENGSYTEISLLWKWVEENDRVDTLIGNKATDLNTIYELTVSVEFKVLNEQCKGV